VFFVEGRQAINSHDDKCGNERASPQFTSTILNQHINEMLDFWYHKLPMCYNQINASGSWHSMPARCRLSFASLGAPVAMYQHEVGSGGSTMRTPASQPVMDQSQSMLFIVTVYSAALVGRT
jgi:hypothetical protein